MKQEIGFFDMNRFETTSVCLLCAGVCMFVYICIYIYIYMCMYNTIPTAKIHIINYYCCGLNIILYLYRT